MDALQKSNKDNNALTPERRLMNEALARIAHSAVTETRRGAEHADRPARVSKPGRLVFVLDLTSSRGPSLHRARIATAAMFDAIKRISSVAVKLIYFRGDSECRAGSWERDPAVVSRAMQRLSCELGMTQIARALQCVLKRETEVSGVVFIGDHCEDDPEELARVAALGKKQTPIFVFHECPDDDERAREARPVFKRMAEISGGMYSEVEPESGKVLSELLSSVAAFSTAGIEGVKQVEPATTPQARQLQTRLLLGPGGDFKEDK